MFVSNRMKFATILCVLSGLINFSAAGYNARLLSELLNDNSKFCTSSNFGNLALTRLSNGRAYFFSTLRVTLTWIQADQYCKANNMNLVSINNAVEYDAIFSQLVALGMNTAGAYLGLSDRLVEGIWRWADGSTPAIQYWAATEPIASATANNCVFTLATATTTPLSWVTNDCTPTLSFVCEVPDRCSYKVAANSPVLNQG